MKAWVARVPSETATLLDQAPARTGRTTAVQQIYEALRKRIVELKLPPGAVLSKRDLAQEFGVSQTPLREALIRLEEEGLVDIFPQSRTAVSLIDVQSAREAHFLRRSVEVEIARGLSADITDEEAEELRTLVERQAADLRRGDLSAFTLTDDRFHERLYDMAGVGGLWPLIHARRAHLDRLRRLHLPAKGKASSILREHRAIIAAIADRNPDAAEAAVRAHLKGTVSSTEDIRAHFPEYFG